MSAPPAKKASIERRPQRAAPTGEPNATESDRRLRLFWYGLACAGVLLGAWGTIGGWWFGLPLGGEVRSDPFEDDGWRLSHLLTTIPDPGFADVPVVPRPFGEGYRLREGLVPTITWEERALPQPVPAPVAPPLSPRLPSKSELAPPRKGALDIGVAMNVAQLPSTAQQQPIGQQGPPPKERQSETQPLTEYVTNLRSASAIVARMPLTATERAYCLSVPSSQPSCLALGGLAGAKPAPVIALASLAVPTRDARVAGVLAFGDGSFEVLDFPFAGSRATSIYALTVGADPAPARAGGATERPVLWVGGLAGRIYKLAWSTGELFSVAELQTPTSGSIGLIVFLTGSRGWAFSEYPDGLEAGNHPAVMRTADGGETWRRLSARWLPAPWVFGAFLIGFVAFDRGTRIAGRLRPPAATRHIADHGVSDDPIGLDDADALGLTPIARAMARFLRNIETKPTVTIAVTGPWGSGKTSLMNLVREELAEQNVRTVWFNAWHHQKEDNLLAALLAAIRAQAIAPVWTLPGFLYRMQVAWRKVSEDPSRAVAFVVLAGFAAALVALFAEEAVRRLAQFVGLIGALLGSGEPAAASAEKTAGAIGAIGLSTGGGLGLIFAVKKIWDLFRPLTSAPADLLASFSAQSGTRGLDQQLSFRYRFADEFSTFCDTLRQPPHPGLVIFVDDLDRCAPRQTVDVLEAINFVTSAGRCFVILGLDEDRVKAAIADVYKDMTLRLDDVEAPHLAAAANDAARAADRTRELIRFASRYLEKLVHLVVPVPRSRKETVEMLLGLGPSPQGPTMERRRQKLRQSLVNFAGTVAVVVFLASAGVLAVGLATSLLPVSQPAGEPSRVAAAAPEGAAGTAPPGRQTTAPQQQPPKVDFVSDAALQQRGLLSGNALEAVPPSALVLAFLMLLSVLALQFLKRLNPEPIVSDSPEFIEALKIWVDGVSARRETPRAVKRFVNRLRFMAMRIREIEGRLQDAAAGAPLDEPELVTFATIEDLDAASLGRTAETLRELPTGDDRRRDVELIRRGLLRFRDEFSRDAYDDPQALDVYRRIAGLVEERGERAEPAEPDRGRAA